MDCIFQRVRFSHFSSSGRREGLFLVLAALCWMVCGALSSQCGISPKANSTFYAETRAVSNRVVGGSLAEQGAWPWIASLRKGSTHKCGATLIDPNWVVTAAHCVAKLSYDIAVLRLAEPMNLVENNEEKSHLPPVSGADNVRPICLPSFVKPFGQHCIIGGWGNAAEKGATSVELREVSLPIYPTHFCMNSKHYFTLIDPASMMCAGFEGGGKDSCQGDSGGPFMCKLGDGPWQLHGVVSWGYGCGRPRRPGVYAKILPAVGWIRSQMIIHKPKKL